MRNKLELINVFNSMEQHCFAQGVLSGEAGDSKWWYDAAGVYSMCSNILAKHDVATLLNVVNELVKRSTVPPGARASLLIVIEIVYS